MNFILLTQEDGMIMGPVSKVLGWIMEGIFTVIDFVGIPNIGLTIILFTIVINLLMMPLTIKQQKYSKLSAKIQPEVQAIQAKYKNRKDEASVMAQNQELQQVYAKYGVSPTGSCGYLLIQMPILFALYRVIYKIPAYVTKIGDTFRVLADKIISVDNGEFLQNSGIESVQTVVDMYGQSMTEGSLQNGIVDVLNRLSSADMYTISQHYDLSQLTYEGELILSNATTTGLIDTYNNFLGINMGDSPSYLVSGALEQGAWLMVLAGLAIPVLSAVTQWINYKLMPQQQNTSSNDANDQAAAMAASMKTMNKVMPIMSAVFCYTMPSGMGLYWVAGSVVRSIQQVVVNKHMDKMDLDEIIRKNSKKSAKKMEKLKANQERMAAYASMNTKNIQSKANPYNYNSNTSNSQSSGNNTTSGSVSNAKPGSMMAKANMVKDYNEKNNK